MLIAYENKISTLMAELMADEVIPFNKRYECFIPKHSAKSIIITTEKFKNNFILHNKKCTKMYIYKNSRHREKTSPFFERVPYSKQEKYCIYIEYNTNFPMYILIRKNNDNL